MTGAFLRGVLAGAILSGTPLLYATLGEVIVERSGVVNLGLEGILLIGASVGFAIASLSGSSYLGVLCAAAAGCLAMLLFGYLVVGRRANQLASGLALMFFGTGVSAVVGRGFVGGIIAGLPKYRVPWLSDLPWVKASTLLNWDILVYIALPVAVAAWWLLFRTRWGLSVRAVGESPAAAFAAGRRPELLQYQALAIGGLLGGIAGAQLSVSVTMSWDEGMTSGRGFIAIALVIFSKWHPLRAVAGALVFGGAEALQLQLQARGAQVSPFLLDMIPYLLTLAVLIAWGGARRTAAPAMLGRTFSGAE
jgi:ABC-type uncharacterized transport system permease subunit